MKSNYIYWIGISVELVVTLYVAATNMSTVELKGFGQPINVSFGGIILGAYGWGLLTIASVWRSFAAREKRGEEKKIEWEKQDVKLMQEVASDEVKLLHAKVATLETALSKALDRAKKKEGGAPASDV